MDNLLQQRAALEQELDRTNRRLEKALLRKRGKVKKQLASVTREEAMLRGGGGDPYQGLPSARLPVKRVNDAGFRSPRDSHDVSTLICRGKHDLRTSYGVATGQQDGAATQRAIIVEQDAQWRKDEVRKRGEFSDYLSASILGNVNLKASNHIE